MFSSPFSNITKNQEKRLLYFLIFSVAICIIILKYLDQFLVNETCTGGIVSFELAKDLDTAGSYLNSWGENGKIAAGLSLGFDFLFPIVYTSLIALLIHKLNVLLWSGKTFSMVGNLLIWLTFLAGLFDYIENIGLVSLLLGNMEQIWVSIAFYFASMKFLILLVAILYILLNFILFLVKKRT